MMRKLALSVALASLSSAAMALGFGEIRLHSGLNQNLNADIPLVSVGGVDLDSIKVKLASSADFARVGAERLLMLDGLQFKVVERNGRPVVEVRSKNSLKEPFLDFVVEMNWPQGRVLRQFTLLLDPPVFNTDSSGQITQVSRPSVPESSRAAPRRAASDTTAAKPRRRVASQPKVALSAGDLAAIQGESYRTKASDNLWKIANRTKPANLSIQQMMEAIYQANPDAFANQDMSQLKNDQLLKIPASADAMKLSSAEAKALVAPDTAAKTVEPAAKTSKRTDLVGPDGKPVSSLDNGSEGRLQLASVGMSDKAAGSDALSTEGGANSEANRVQSELLRSQEAMETVNRENTELKARLEEMTAKMQALEKKLITVNSPELAAMTSTTETTPAAQPDKPLANTTDTSATTGSTTSATTPPAADPSVTTPATTPTTPVAADPATTPTTPAVATDPAATTPTPEPVNAELQAVVAEPIAVKPVHREKPVTLLPKEEAVEDSLLAFVTEPQNYPYLGIGAGLLAILGYFLLRRRKMQQQVSEPVFVGSYQDTQAAASSANAPKLELRDPPVSAHSDTAHAKGAIDLADVMSEVDIYVAYGRFSQAETLLRDALSHAPDRLEIKMKLLECLGQMGRADEFDQLAEEVRTSHGADPIVLAQIDDHYQAAWPNESRAERPASISLDEEPATETKPLDLAKVSFDEPVTTEKVDLPPLAFELDDEPKTGSKKAAKAQAKVAAASELSLSDLELAPASEDPLSDGLTASLDDSELASLASDEDGAMTKLHLAEAYIDMGDIAGARDILSEVLNEGSPQQRKEAQAMLNKIV